MSSKLNNIKGLASYILCMVLFITNSNAYPKSTTELKEVTLTLLSQRWIPDKPLCEREKGDVIVVVSDDLLVQFRLANNSKENIYYLSSVYEPEPTGYLLYRKVGGTEWKATSPDRGREGSLTGGGYKWQLLPPGTSVEFKFSDLSSREGEHAVSVLVNSQPEHAGRVEIISDSYRPMQPATKNTEAQQHNQRVTRSTSRPRPLSFRRN